MDKYNKTIFMAMTHDFDVSVFIITSGRHYIPMDEYVRELDGEGEFVMLTNDRLNQDFNDDNSICIYSHWVSAVNEAKEKLSNLIQFEKETQYVSCQWQTDYETIPGAFKLNDDTDKVGADNTSIRENCMLRHLDGNHTNREIIREVLSMNIDIPVERYIPAIMVAHHTEVLFCGKTLHGYLSMIGQLTFINKNIFVLNDALKKTGAIASLFQIGNPSRQMIGLWWSSAQYDNSRAWCMFFGQTMHSDKNLLKRVLPLFSI